MGWGAAGDWLRTAEGSQPTAGYALDSPTGKEELLALQSEEEHLKTLLAEVESRIRDLEQGDGNQQE